MSHGEGRAPGPMDETASHVDVAEAQATATNFEDTRATQSINVSAASSPDVTKTKLGFANLARVVAARWKTLDDATKSVFEEKSQLDKDRYKQELSEWKKKLEWEPKNEPNGVDAMTTLTEVVETMPRTEVSETPRSRAATPVGWSLSRLVSMDPPKLVTPEKKSGFLGNNRVIDTLPEGKSLFGEDGTNQSADGESLSGSSMDGFLVPNLSTTRTLVSRSQPVVSPRRRGCS
jgi:HMG (high mobility group) box